MSNAGTIAAASATRSPIARDIAISAAIGGLVLAVGLGVEPSRLVLGVVSAFVCAAVWTDVRTLRIPNPINFSMLAAGIAFGAWTSGASGALRAVVAAAIVFLVLLAPYAARALGAGDVKCVMALGAWFAPLAAGALALRSLVVSALLGVAWLAWRRELGDFARRWIAILLATASTRRLQYVPPPTGSAAGSGLPFATAVGIAVAWQWLSGGMA